MCLAQVLAEGIPSFGHGNVVDLERLLITASGNGFIEFLKACVKVRGKFSSRVGTLASHMAARRGQLKVLQYLLAQGKCNIVQVFGGVVLPVM